MGPFFLAPPSPEGFFSPPVAWPGIFFVLKHFFLSTLLSFLITFVIFFLTQLEYFCNHKFNSAGDKNLEAKSPKVIKVAVRAKSTRTVSRKPSGAGKHTTGGEKAHLTCTIFEITGPKKRGARKDYVASRGGNDRQQSRWPEIS